MQKLINLIKNNLSDDLLNKKYLQQKNRNKYSGHCYVATEALYYLIKDNENYCPSTLKINDGVTHWFLIHKKTKEIIDITKEQFNFKLDYPNSINKGFLTKAPSKRALILINRVKNHNLSIYNQ